MKYTIKEQIKISKIREELEILKNKKLIKRKKIIDIEKQIDELSSLELKIGNKIYKINEKVVKRCKHNGERYKVINWRDDASFLYWIRCKDCGETVGHEGENPGHY